MEDEFLLDVVNQVFKGEVSKSFERAFFKLRFKKDFDALKEVGRQLKAENTAWVSGNWSGFQTSRIMKPLLEVFGSEIQQDYRDVAGFNFDLWESPGRGGFSPPKAAFKWLWDCKYPRWIWSRLVNQARPAGQEIEMREILDENRAPKKGGLPKIVKNKNCQCFLEFKMSGHLLLLGKDSREVYCLCPSPGFAPDTQLLAERPVVLPQPSSRLAVNGEYLSFSNLGTETFLAVVTPEPLGLSWAKPGGKDDCFTLTTDSLVELYKTIHEQEAHLFYRAFDVVDSH
jgi:hypothetical protein